MSKGQFCNTDICSIILKILYKFLCILLKKHILSCENYFIIISKDYHTTQNRKTLKSIYIEKKLTDAKSQHKTGASCDSTPRFTIPIGLGWP